MNFLQMGFSGPALAATQGVDDFEIVTIGGYRYLYTASRGDDDISALRLSADGSATLVETAFGVLPQGNLAYPDITIAEIEGNLALVHQDGAGAIVSRILLPDGGFGAVQTHALSSATAVVTEAIAQSSVSIDLHGTSYLVSTQLQGPGLQVTALEGAFGPFISDAVDDTPDIYLGDVSALAFTEYGGQSLVFAASAEENGLTAYRLNTDGTLTERGSIGAGNEFWVSTPTDLDVLKVDGSIFVVVGAAGSNSVTILAVGLGGALEVVDHVIDDANSRFDDLTALATVSHEGRAFVAAAGSDDGLSLFELDGDGHLHLVTTFQDESGTLFSDVSSLNATVFGDELQIFVSNGSEGNMSVLAMDVSELGESLSGGRWDDMLGGTDQDDILLGRQGDDTLSGGAGDDRLVDGEGADLMSGGVGQDVFSFAFGDGCADTIADFEVGIDQIDLSDFPLLHDMSRLEVMQNGNSVMVSYFDEIIHVSSMTGFLDASELTEESFQF